MNRTNLRATLSAGCCAAALLLSPPATIAQSGTPARSDLRRAAPAYETNAEATRQSLML